MAANRDQVEPTPRRRLIRWILAAAFLGALALLSASIAMAVLRADRSLDRRLAEAQKEVNWYPAETLPARWRDWLLAVEDPAFQEHNGVDIETSGAGLTTLTQAIVKLLFYDDWKPGPLNKLDQTAIAYFVVDSRMAKAAQLEYFVNRAYLGHVDGRPVTGFAYAARTYYGTELEKLDDQEFLSLLAMLVAPREFHPIHRPDANRERVTRILRLVDGACHPNGNGDVLLEGCAAPPR